MPLRNKLQLVSPEIIKIMEPAWSIETDFLKSQPQNNFCYYSRELQDFSVCPPIADLFS